MDDNEDLDIDEPESEDNGDGVGGIALALEDEEEHDAERPESDPDDFGTLDADEIEAQSLQEVRPSLRCCEAKLMGYNSVRTGPGQQTAPRPTATQGCRNVHVPSSSTTTAQLHPARAIARRCVLLVDMQPTFRAIVTASSRKHRALLALKPRLKLVDLPMTMKDTMFRLSLTPTGHYLPIHCAGLHVAGLQ